MRYSKNIIQILMIAIIFSSCTSIRAAKKEEKKTLAPTPLESSVPSQPSQSSKNEITFIETMLSPHQKAVHISADSPIKYTAFKLTQPLRLVLDLTGLKPASSLFKSKKFNDEIINSLSQQYFESSKITRIEIGLNKIIPHEILREGKKKIKIHLKKPLSETDQKKGSEIVIPETEKDKTTLIASPLIATEKKPLSSGEKIPEEIASMGLDENEYIIEEVYIDEEDEPEKHEPPKEKIEPPALAIAPMSKDKKKYSGKLISLDFQDADIANILRFIAEVSNFNIITSDDVKGKINLKLNNVPWDQALNIILKAKSLGMEQEGNIIRVAPLSTLKSEKEQRIKLEETERESKLKAEQMKLDEISAQQKTENLVTEVIPINYASAKDILKNVQKLKSERGEIDLNDRTNTLIVKDLQKNLDSMESLIGRLDKRTPQVMIEARIVEVTRTLSKELGIQWGGLYNKSTSYIFPNNVGLSGGIAPASSSTDLQLVNTSPNGANYVTHLPAAVGSGSGGAVSLTLGHLLGSAGLDITLSALENSGNGKILSNPKITTEDNKKAVIESGRSIPYSTVSQSGTQIQFVDAVISLTVTPHITPDGFVSMKIMATKNDADFGNQVQGTPSILTKKAETQVLVKNGDTTVIGGLYTNNSQRSFAGVPWFSKLPILGWFFKKKTQAKSSTELLIFITPRILES